MLPLFALEPDVRGVRLQPDSAGPCDVLGDERFVA